MFLGERRRDAETKPRTSWPRVGSMESPDMTLESPVFATIFSTQRFPCPEWVRSTPENVFCSVEPWNNKKTPKPDTERDKRKTFRSFFCRLFYRVENSFGVKEWNSFHRFLSSPEGRHYFQVAFVCEAITIHSQEQRLATERRKHWKKSTLLMERLWMTVILGNYSTEAMYSVEKSTKGRVEQWEARADRSMTLGSPVRGFHSVEKLRRHGESSPKPYHRQWPGDWMMKRFLRVITRGKKIRLWPP